ncbi:NAD(P)-binding protein [Kitasatospora sp. RG8]|nr:NAD(P)-binding protein [Kitasatospora sp. RG8]
MSGVRRVQVLVVGAGQAGLAAGYHLRRAGLDFAILDASNAPGGAWQHYGESLRLFSPAAYSSLPGRPMPNQAGSEWPGRFLPWRGSCSRPDADVRSVDDRAATLDQ